MKKKIAAAAAVMGALASTIAFAQPASAGVDPRYYRESSWSTEGDCKISGHSGKQEGRWSDYFCSASTYSWDLYVKR
ncbi:hypothetical protein [Amycolatopsis sp. BJA-103]|uniref:hypothetical protein n=1 Tax=unclassified Amycolatopsis TaxID=2618356 RepID=UPI000C793F0D|nr:hypothetical protein [Amycolatopsis sp. BJA-103]AUI59619.1 hypothetical protein BKN51_16260 [Amycolatopsis sp. BJA-103]PNE16933.1 hypothetical protein B1H26_18245 [Amycolatopsis sp. BJA-103]